nr:sugar nucleotide-binding protein [bacterium]
MPTVEANNILVVGAGGMLGGMLLKVLARSRKTAGVDIGECDITSPEAVARNLDIYRPAWVVNAAAYTDVDGCEADPELAARVNGTAPGILALACRERGVGLVHISTDFVFDGRGNRPYREGDPPAPIN